MVQGLEFNVGLYKQLYSKKHWNLILFFIDDMNVIQLFTLETVDRRKKIQLIAIFKQKQDF